jgi:hypothetical protein
MGETRMSSNRNFASGLVGGVIGGSLATLGLMKISKPTQITITSNKQVIQPQSLNAGATATLLPQTTYKFAIILFYGDGDPQIQLSIVVGSNTYTLNGDEQAIEVLADESITITASNTDTANPHNTPTIEIAYLTW